jgi:hypothetical protein
VGGRTDFLGFEVFIDRFLDRDIGGLGACGSLFVKSEPPGVAET